MTGKIHSPHMLKNPKSPKTHLTMEHINQLIKKNPYNLPPDEKLLTINDENNERAKTDMRQRSRTRIEFRQPQNLPRLQSVHSVMGEPVDEIKPVATEHQRRQQMHGFVEQTRDILLAQLKIGRKSKEIERIMQQQLTEQGIIQTQIARIAETNNQYDMTSNSLKAELNRAKKECDKTLNEKKQLQRELKFKYDTIARIKAEITKNEDIVFSYRNYSEFLKSLTPSGENPLDRFQEPQTLLNEFEQLESDNLFLIQKCCELEQESDRAMEDIRKELTTAQEEKRKMENAEQKINPIAVLNCNDTAIQQDSRATDDELAQLSKYIQSAYVKCFGSKSDFGPTTMLERLENELEVLYKKIAELPPEFVNETQAHIEKARRDQARADRQAQKLLEQRRKTEQAIERANRPVTKKMGRPLKVRVLPMQLTHHVNDEKKAQDEKLQEELLFGPLDD